MKPALAFALLAAACTPSGRRTGSDAGSTNDLAMSSDLAMHQSPDFATNGPRAVGAPCTADAQCNGPTPMCYKSIPTYNNSAPNGFCSSACSSDGDCGPNAYCDNDFGGSYICIPSCTAAGQCQKANPDNRCLYLGKRSGCQPSSASRCQPTEMSGCGQGKVCVAIGYDDVGACADTCMLPNNCASGGCYFRNDAMDPYGHATPQYSFADLVCLPDGFATQGASCTNINDCAPGFECDILGTTGSQQCLQLCRRGYTICTTGLCNNAFALSNFGLGSYGLCY